MKQMSKCLDIASASLIIILCLSSNLIFAAQHSHSAQCPVIGFNLGGNVHHKDVVQIGPPIDGVAGALISRVF